MLTSVHLVTGAAIGKLTGNLWISIPIALLSHYLLDIIPHYNPKPVKGYQEGGFLKSDKKDLMVKSLEPLMGILVVLYSAFYLNRNIFWIMILSAFFAWLPDLIIFLRWRYGVNIPLPLVGKIERDWHRHTSFLTGTLIQIFIFLISLYYIL